MMMSLKRTLKKILGRRPRKEKVILCHGNFDVVHPGHVRHLTYAKSKADKLIVSITADKFIQKGIYRPFVPQNIRAINIAAFEMVNYVIIDDNKKPLNLIRDLKPDYFAKGFEYNSSGLPPATKEEQEVVTKYGGDIIFTPGDIVYSSTKILNIAQPEISNFKLLDLMKRNKISGIPVVENDNKLVGILTNRDVRFVTNSNIKVKDLMTTKSGYKKGTLYSKDPSGKRILKG